VTLEHRSLLEQPEFRSEGTRIVASGVAMRYGARSKPIGGKFREQFTPGSFAKTIKEQNVEAKLARVDLTIAPYYDDSTAELALRSLATDKGLELRSVMEAAERGELPTLISSSTEDDDEEQRSDLTPAGDPPARDRITWLYL
jgi:hypothetical protein